jgi:hypothetical protein
MQMTFIVLESIRSGEIIGEMIKITVFHKFIKSGSLQFRVYDLFLFLLNLNILDTCSADMAEIFQYIRQTWVFE